jgi:hypothetical protein
MSLRINRGIELFIDVQQSESRNRLMIGWESPNGLIGGHIDMTELFFSIRDYWEQKTRNEENK